MTLFCNITRDNTVFERLEDKMEMFRLGRWGSSRMVNGLVLRNNVHRCYYYYCYNNYNIPFI